MANDSEHRDDNGRFLAGISGNPAGRPPKTRDLARSGNASSSNNGTDQASIQLQHNAKLIAVAEMAAEKGDIQALKLLFAANYTDGMSPELRAEIDDIKAGASQVFQGHTCSHCGGPISAEKASELHQTADQLREELCKRIQKFAADDSTK
jgi:hypothetical protein